MRIASQLAQMGQRERSILRIINVKIAKLSKMLLRPTEHSFTKCRVLHLVSGDIWADKNGLLPSLLPERYHVEQGLSAALRLRRESTGRKHP